MPLVLMCGFPLSGKSTVARELAGYLREKGANVVVHSDETLGHKGRETREEDYNDTHAERKLRNEIMSAVRRDLSRSTIVIVDSLNYIKGFRYQLHCECKNSNTGFMLVHCMATYADILKRDENGEESPRWGKELLDQLIQRFEEPDASNRWDSPMATVVSPETLLPTHKQLVDQVLLGISDKSSSRNGSPSPGPMNRLSQNNPTLLKAATGADFVRLLDAKLTETVRIIVRECQAAQAIGGPQRIIVSEDVRDINDDRCLFLDIPVDAPQLTLPRLNRLKRQFVQMNKNLRDVDLERAAPLFVAYIGQTLQSGLA
ncbi:Protein KTI12 [Nakaseomyces glabratus]|nr:Protein KTI12 [Nakaseomyces glabratus]KTB25944.1 Protein KTI12 [Nakaseomyces glabratus]